jgi:hypothetical protein
LGGGENTSQTTQALARIKKRNEWTHRDEKNLVGVKFILSLPFFRLLCRSYKLVFWVHAWLVHYMDCINGNAKPGVKFWGAIADTYNSTTDAHHQRTLKNLKDH